MTSADHYICKNLNWYFFLFKTMVARLGDFIVFSHFFGDVCSNNVLGTAIIHTETYHSKKEKG
jgi:hypothetical protein